MRQACTKMVYSQLSHDVTSLQDCVDHLYWIYSFFPFFLKKMGHSRPLFIYFRLFNTVDNKQMFNKILPMTGVEPRTSGFESDRSTN